MTSRRRHRPIRRGEPVSQSENERTTKQPEGQTAPIDRELSDTELESIAAAGDDPIKGDSNGGGSSPFKKK
jgi:hypothetical protein